MWFTKKKQPPIRGLIGEGMKLRGEPHVLSPVGTASAVLKV